jgi:hypothetical protein
MARSIIAALTLTTFELAKQVIDPTSAGIMT